MRRVSTRKGCSSRCIRNAATLAQIENRVVGRRRLGNSKKELRGCELWINCHRFFDLWCFSAHPGFFRPFYSHLSSLTFSLFFTLSLSLSLSLSLASLFFPIDSICLRLIDWVRSSSISPSSIPPPSPSFRHSCSRNGTNNAVNVLIASGSIRFPVLVVLRSCIRLTIPLARTSRTKNEN